MKAAYHHSTGHTFQKVVSSETLPVLDVFHHVVCKLVHMTRGPTGHRTPRYTTDRMTNMSVPGQGGS